MAEHDRMALVAGGGLGGLSAAIHLRLKGFDVALLEKNTSLGGRANRLEAEGYTFDTGPSLLNYPWVFEELFAAAGKRMEDYVRLIAVDPSIHFHWPDGQAFALSSNIPRLLAECERLEPGVGPGLFAFLRDAERKYRFSFDRLVVTNEDNPVKWFLRLKPGDWPKTAVWRSLYGELHRFFRSRRLCEAFGSYAMYLGGSPWELPGLFSILPYGELAYGLWLPEGGVYGMVNAVARLAADLGVRIELGAEVERIVVRQGCVQGVRLRGGAEIPCPLVVSNVDVPETQARLLGGAHARTPRVPRMTPGVLTLYWGIRHRATGLPHHSIFLPDDSRGSFRDLLDRKAIPGDLPFYICLASETDPSLAPEGHATAFVLAPVPLVSEFKGGDWASAVETVKEKVFRRLRQHGVALAPEDIAFERAWTPVDWAARFGLYDGSAFGAAHRLFQVGPFRSKNHDPEIKGLYYVGASTTPGTGMPMVVLGGRMVAERIASHVL